MRNGVMIGCIHPRSNWGRRRSCQCVSGVGDRLRRIPGLAGHGFSAVVLPLPTRCPGDRGCPVLFGVP